MLGMSMRKHRERKRACNHSSTSRPHHALSLPSRILHEHCPPDCHAETKAKHLV